MVVLGSSDRERGRENRERGIGDGSEREGGRECERESEREGEVKR